MNIDLIKVVFVRFAPVKSEYLKSTSEKSVNVRFFPEKLVNIKFASEKSTRSKFVLVFPELDDGMEVLSLIYSSEIFMRFDLHDIPLELVEMFKVKEEHGEEETLH